MTHLRLVPTATLRTNVPQRPHGAVVRLKSSETSESFFGCFIFKYANVPHRILGTFMIHVDIKFHMPSSIDQFI
jgi:hypothetical protein